MQALVSARGVNAETLRAAASATSRPLKSPILPELRRLAAVTSAGAGSPVAPTERADTLITLLADRFPQVRLEAARAWARQESRESGCQRLLDTLKDPSLAVVLTVIDALGDACKDDINVSDRLTAEARPPEPNEWHRASHALVALAKRSPGRTFIPLLGGHVQHVTWQVRMYAARAAAIVNEVSALERLGYDREDNVRQAALAPLRRLKKDEAEPYLRRGARAQRLSAAAHGGQRAERGEADPAACNGVAGCVTARHRRQKGDVAGHATRAARTVAGNWRSGSSWGAGAASAGFRYSSGSGGGQPDPAMDRQAAGDRSAAAPAPGASGGRAVDRAPRA